MNKTSLPLPTNPSQPQSDQNGQPRQSDFMTVAFHRFSSLVLARFSGMQGVLWAGAISSALYIFMVLGFPMTRWWFHPDDTLSSIAERSPWTHFFLHLGPSTLFPFWLGLLSTLIIAVLFAMQMLALTAAYTIDSLQRARRLLIGFPILFIVILIWLQPMTSSDLYGYLARAYLIAELHRNPLISLATFLPGGYLVPHARPPAPYGPIWLLLMGGIGSLTSEHLFVAMLLDKILTSVATIASIMMAAWISDRTLPGQRLAPLVLVGWSPLLLFEAIGNGHNDIVMMAFVLASLVSIVGKKPMLAFPLLAMGVLIKYSVGALVPIWAAYLIMRFAWKGNAPIWPEYITRKASWPNIRNAVLYWRNQIDWTIIAQIFGIGGAISVAIATIAYAPFWAGIKSFTGLGQQLGATYFFISPIQFVFYAVQAVAPQLPAASTGSALRFVFYGLFALYALNQAYGILRRGPHVAFAHFVQGAGNTVLAILLLITFWYQPWYIVWLVPLAALAPVHSLRRNMILLSLGGMLTYPVQHFAFFYTQPSARDAVVQFTMTLAAFGLLLFFQHRFSLRILVTERYKHIDRFLEHHPAVAYRTMFILILISALLLRLMNLGTTLSLSTLSHSVAASLLDAPGLSLVFSAMQSTSTLLFGYSAFALSLPSAIAGTFSVWMVYLLASQIFLDLPDQRHRVIGIIVAILMATSEWFVSLARIGTHVTILPALMATATLAYWKLLHEQVQSENRCRMWILLAAISLGSVADLESPLLPAVIVIGVIISAKLFARQRKHGWLFVSSAVAATIPSLLDLMRSGWSIIDTKMLSPFSPAFWLRGIHNAGTLLHIAAMQDYSSVGSKVTAVPWLLLPFSLIGGIWTLAQWRSPLSRLLIVLLIAPFFAIFILPVSTSIIAGVALLPIICLLPAIGLERVVYEVSKIMTNSSEVRASGVISDESIVQVTLLLFVIMMTVSTFVWFFAQTVPGPTHIISPM